MQFSKKRNSFCTLLFPVFEYTLNFQHLKNEHHSLCISEIIDFERSGYLNPSNVLFLKTFLTVLRVTKTDEICKKAVLTHFFIILSHTELEKIPFSQI